MFAAVYKGIELSSDRIVLFLINKPEICHNIWSCLNRWLQDFFKRWNPRTTYIKTNALGH